ncbi:MAG: hypothetical protein R3Y54_14315 [Eubacteriales bacterium]
MTKIQEIYNCDECKVVLANEVEMVVQSIDICEAQNDDGEELGYEEVAVNVLNGTEIIDMIFLKEEDIILVKMSK